MHCKVHSPKGKKFLIFLLLQQPPTQDISSPWKVLSFPIRPLPAEIATPLTSLARGSFCLFLNYRDDKNHHGVVLLSVWLFSLAHSLEDLSMCGEILSFFFALQYSVVWTYHSWLTRSAIVNKSALMTCVHAFWDMKDKLCTCPYGH